MDLEGFIVSGQGEEMQGVTLHREFLEPIHSKSTRQLPSPISSEIEKYYPIARLYCSHWFAIVHHH